MGLDMSLYYGPKLGIKGVNLRILDKGFRYIKRSSEFFFPNANKYLEKDYNDLLPKVRKYYRDESNKKGSGKLPMSEPSLEDILSGNATLNTVGDVYEFNSYYEWEKSKLEEYNDGINCALIVKQNMSEIKRLLKPHQGLIPFKVMGTWRKAPSIHYFFTSKSKNKIVNGEAHEISYDDILNLKSLCLEAKKNMNDEEKLKKLFPMIEGAFFGSYEYEEDFAEDLDTTLEIINSHLEKMKNEDPYAFEYYYVFSS